MNNKIKTITPKALTSQAFSAFGDVIEAHDDNHKIAINDGYTQRYHDLAEVDVNDQGGRALINIFRSTPLPQPKGDFDVSQLQVFIAQSNQGVNYHKGTWHHFCLALGGESDFLVIDRGGEGDNCDVVTLDGSLVIATS